MNYGDFTAIVAIVAIGLATLGTIIGLSILLTWAGNRRRLRHLQTLASRTEIRVLSVSTHSHGRIWARLSGELRQMPVEVRILRNTVTVGSDTAKTTGYCITEILLTNPAPDRISWEIRLNPGTSIPSTPENVSTSIVQILKREGPSFQDCPLLLRSMIEGYSATLFCDLHHETDIKRVEQAIRLLAEIVSAGQSGYNDADQYHQPSGVR